MDKRKLKRMLRKIGKAADYAKRQYESGAMDEEFSIQWALDEVIVRCGKKNIYELYALAHGGRYPADN